MTDARRQRPASRGLLGSVAEVVGILGLVLLVLSLRVIAFQPFTIPSASEEPNLVEGDYVIVSKFSYGWSRHSIPFSPPLFSGRIFFHAPQRGDVVVFKLPRDGRTDYIKRLVGLPGDRIQLKGGVVYVNGQPLARTPLPAAQGTLPEGYGPVQRFLETAANGHAYVIQTAASEGAADDTGVYVVPPHCYFMMGDNRDNSLDSRFDPALPAAATSGSASCGWNPAVDQYVPQEAGVGFVPEEDLVGKAELILFSWRAGGAAADVGGRLPGLRANRFGLAVS